MILLSKMDPDRWFVKIGLALFILFFILIVLVVLLAVSAYLLWFEFPRGYHADRATWVDIHKWTGVALAVLVIIHIVLHWKWLVQMTRYYLRNIKATATQAKETEDSRVEDE